MIVIFLCLLMVGLVPVVAQDIGFVPNITKLGFVEAADGGRDEQLVWFITVHNDGDAPGTNLLVTDTVRDELRIDSVEVPEGSTYSIHNQTVLVNIPTLTPGNMVIIQIRTTVIRRATNDYIDNMACLSAAGLAIDLCTTAPTIRALPATGESSRWRALPLVMFALFIIGGIVATWGFGVMIRRRDRILIS